jgi:hypothetical protein
MAAGRVVMLALALAGCGGLSDQHDGRSGPGDAGEDAGARGGSGGSAASGAAGTNAGGAGNGAGTGGSGTAGTGGIAGACTSEQDCTFAPVNDFDESGWYPGLLIAGAVTDYSSYVVSLDPPRGESQSALHLDEPDELGGADLGFHMHQPLWVRDPDGLGGPYVGVRFLAKRGENGPTSLVVAITGLAQERTDYVSDLEAGRPWLARRFELTTEWQRYFALFRDFAPEGDGEAAPALDEDGQVVHFIVPRGEPLDVWLDDIEFACAGTCLQ